MSKYWYEFKLRGLSLGAQPKGFVDSNDKHGRHGAVAYSRPLTEQELEEYELAPTNLNEEQ